MSGKDFKELDEPLVYCPKWATTSPGATLSKVLGVLVNLRAAKSAAKQGRPCQAEVSPGPCLPRFAKYYRDAAGVEVRTLMKAYGIRFDVMVNGRVGEPHLPFGGWAGRGGGGMSMLGGLC